MFKRRNTLFLIHRGVRASFKKPYSLRLVFKGCIVLFCEITFFGFVWIFESKLGFPKDSPKTVFAQKLFAQNTFRPSQPRLLTPAAGPRSQQTKLLMPAAGSPAT